MTGTVSNSLLLVASSGTSVTTGGSTTASDVALTTTTGNTIVIRAVFGNASQYPTGVPTDSKGNTYLAKVTRQTDGSGGGTSIWVCENATGGSSHTFSCSFNASLTSGLDFEVIEIAGVTAASYDAAVLAIGTDAASPFTITSGTPAQADELILSFYHYGNGTDGAGGGTIAETSGMTGIRTTVDGTYWPAGSAYKVISSAAAQTPSWTYTQAGVYNVVSVLGFKLATAWTGTALTGKSVTTSRGAITLGVSKALDGKTATTARGTVATGAAFGLTGKSVSTAQGTIGYSTASDLTIALTGKTISAAQGVVGVGTSKALVGKAITASPGTLGFGVSRQLAGAQITAARGTLAYKAAFGLDGHEASMGKGSVSFESTHALSGSEVTTAQGSVVYTDESVLQIALIGFSVAASQGVIGVEVESSESLKAGGKGSGNKRHRLAILEVDGIEYRIPATDVQSFLNALVKPKQAKKLVKAAKKVFVAPVVTVIEAPQEVEAKIEQQVDRTNELLLEIWKKAIEREIEEEEELLWLLVA